MKRSAVPAEHMSQDLGRGSLEALGALPQGEVSPGKEGLVQAVASVQGTWQSTSFAAHQSLVCILRTSGLRLREY